MLVSFPFTFKMLAPGLANPFTTNPTTDPQDQPDLDADMSHAGMHRLPRSEPASSYCPTPVSRKRGWEPSFAEPSRSTTTLASSSGYLDTPAKYRDMVGYPNPTVMDHVYHEATMNDHLEEMPPTKRRRGLAGSIVSTALSAALIGTAVGLTVYRLWRDRGKHPEELPPPPYEQEWTPIPEQLPEPIKVVPSTPRSARKSRLQVSSVKRPAAHHRRTRSRPQVLTPAHTSPAQFPPTQPEFNFGPQEANTPPLEDQMDWIGDKLSMLIEQGKRALNREIVVMSDAKEDEVDDGSGQWEEEQAHPSVSRSSSIKRKQRPQSLGPSPPSYTTSSSRLYPASASPRRSGFAVESPFVTPSTSFAEDESTWESPELRESMAKARARFLASRGTYGWFPSDPRISTPPF